VRGGNGLVSAKELRRATRQADVLGLPLGDDVEGDRTRSDLELDFLGLCRRYRLPVPEVNVRIGGYLIDFLWRDRGVAVETDSYLYHRGREAFRDDRNRDLDLRALGFQVIRLSEKQVDEEAPRVAEVLRRALRVGADG
jgi:very-short-patch-repair endonuclease